MEQIKIDEFNKLPKKGPITAKKLQPGKMYYIQERSAQPKFKYVFIGRYIEPRSHNMNDKDIAYNFENVKFVVNPFKTKATPFAFYPKSNTFFEVVDFNPTELDFINKNKTIRELSEFITQKRMESHDSTPPISFMGEDYRNARSNFYNKSSSKSRSRSRSSSRSMSSTKKGGRKVSKKRRTVRRHSRK
jgi:hypothetical protein